MLIEAQVPIHASRAAVWSAITDIEGAAKLITGIRQIEIVERPASGLIGLRWRETRLLFGEPATAEKWITDAVEGESYRTRAESHGFVFLTTLRISGSGSDVTLTSSHDSVPQGFIAGLKLIPMALFFRGVAKKAILQDLHDIKAAAEHGHPPV